MEKNKGRRSDIVELQPGILGLLPDRPAAARQDDRQHAGDLNRAIILSKKVVSYSYSPGFRPFVDSGHRPQDEVYDEATQITRWSEYIPSIQKINKQLHELGPTPHGMWTLKQVERCCFWIDRDGPDYLLYMYPLFLAVQQDLRWKVYDFDWFNNPDNLAYEIAVRVSITAHDTRNATVPQYTLTVESRRPEYLAVFAFISIAGDITGLWQSNLPRIVDGASIGSFRFKFLWKERRASVVRAVHIVLKQRMGINKDVVQMIAMMVYEMDG